MTIHQLAPQTTEAAEIMTITPAVAKRWLARNVRNRKLKERDIAKYARDMASGNWNFTGEAIKFDTNGAIADGQHRLHAIVRSGVPCQLLVVRGIDPDAQSVMDSGVKRSVADSLTLEGIADASIVASAARLALKETAAGIVPADARVLDATNSEIRAFVELHPEVKHAAQLARSFYPDFDAPPSVLAVAWMALSKIDIDAAATFFHSVSNNATDGPGDPRNALIRRIASARRNGEKLTQAQNLSLIYRAWNAYRAGATVRSLPADAKIPMVLR